MSSIFTQLPPDHFGQTMETTLRLLARGESVCVYSLPGGGRKYFLRQAEYLLTKQNQSNLLFFEAQASGNALKQELTKALAKALDIKIIQNFFSQASERFSRRSFILLLGHIEDMTNKQEVLSFLLTLRNLTPKGFVVLSTCNYEILTKSDDYTRYGKILFCNLIAIPRFSFEGTKAILTTNQSYFGFHYSESVFNHIYELSGGHPSLVKYLGKFVDDFGQEALSNLPLLINYQPLQIKLRELTDVAIVEDQSILYQLGMIDKKGNLFSPLIRYYLQTFDAKDLQAVFINLTSQERRVLAFFVENMGKLLSIDHLSFLMGRGDDDFSLWAVYKTISRLKKKLPTSYRLIAHKNQGYSLERS